jgi:hypothetical protein
MKSNFNNRVYHERRRAARNNVDQSISDSNVKIKRENNVNNELKERKHILNLKLKKLRKIKRENEYKYQSSNLSDKREIRKKFERESEKIKGKIRDINHEKQIIIRLREVNNRLMRENRDIKIELDENRKLKKGKYELINEKTEAIKTENILKKNENGILSSVIQYLRKWLTMLKY